jgi:hypothetical protein
MNKLRIGRQSLPASRWTVPQIIETRYASDVDHVRGLSPRAQNVSILRYLIEAALIVLQNTIGKKPPPVIVWDAPAFRRVAYPCS